MSPLRVATCLVVAAIQAASAAVELQEIRLGSKQDIPVLVSPAAHEAEEEKPAVIVIQEWWGVTDGIKDKAQRIAANGYRVLIPDVYKGKVGVNKEEASHLMGELDFQNAVKEISTAAAYLKQSGAPHVGVVGFCMGGALALGSLAASPDIDAGAPFYGLNRGLFDVKTLMKPVQGHFGAEDTMEGFSDPLTGRKLAQDLTRAGNEHAEAYVYEDVGHAFMNDSPAPWTSFEARQKEMGFPPYRADRAEMAWTRLLSFFDLWLKSYEHVEL
mmetsp:Transcript_12235/g.37627  ORF Transcript_12235/g.37627 Transcript_12235/m.37627 type:complete len:271 (-) Transcript_12235:250-1062(-)